MGDYFLFGLISIKKKNQTKIIIFLKKPKPVQTDRFRFWFFRTKTGSNRFGSVFSVWLSFFRFGFCSVRFFRFQAYKTKPVSFFKILIGFFSWFGFFFVFFSFFNLINFPVFLLTPDVVNILSIFRQRVTQGNLQY